VQLIDEDSGAIVDISESVQGPTADINRLEQSGLMEKLPENIGGIGDLAYVSLYKLHPQGLGASPRRKPHRKPRPPEG
jgi:hypothetical protein